MTLAELYAEEWKLLIQDQIVFDENWPNDECVVEQTKNR